MSITYFTDNRRRCPLHQHQPVLQHGAKPLLAKRRHRLITRGQSINPVQLVY